MIRFVSRRAASGRVRRAVAAVEFAVLAPFLFTLATGAFEVGRGIMVRQILTDAAEGLPQRRPPRSNQLQHNVGSQRHPVGQ